VALVATGGLRNDGPAHLCDECQSTPVPEPGDSIVALFGLEIKLEFLFDRQTIMTVVNEVKTNRPSTQTGL